MEDRSKVTLHMIPSGVQKLITGVEKKVFSSELCENWGI